MKNVDNMYHFHKDCMYFPKCVEKEDKIDGHKVKRFWCPAMSRKKHNQTTVLKGKTYNLGESYDKSGGNAYYPNDLHAIKWECSLFVPFQNNLFEAGDDK